MNECKIPPYTRVICDYLDQKLAVLEYFEQCGLKNPAPFSGRYESGGGWGYYYDNNNYIKIGTNENASKSVSFEEFLRKISENTISCYEIY